MFVCHDAAAKPADLNGCIIMTRIRAEHIKTDQRLTARIHHAVRKAGRYIRGVVPGAMGRRMHCPSSFSVTSTPSPESV